MKEAELATRKTSSEPGYKCSKCQDSGVIMYQVDGIWYGKECECEKEKRTKKNIERAGFNALFENKDFSNYEARTKEQETLKKVCQGFVSQDEIKSIALLGNVGSGKTHLAVAILKEIAKKGRTVYPIGYVELARTLSANALDEVAYNRIMGNLATVNTLMIDDLFKGKVTEANLRAIYELINRRYTRNLATIITSEKNLEELMDLDSAIASRIAEMAGQKYVLNIQKIDNYRLRRRA